MAAFEVLIESSGGASLALKLVVEAESWVEAWLEGLRVMGDGVAPPDAECVLRADRSLEITVASTQQRYVVRERRAASADAASPSPTPPIGEKALVRDVTGALRRPDPAARAAAPRRPLERSPPLGKAAPPAAPPAPVDAPSGRPQRQPPRLDDAPGGITAVVNGRARGAVEPTDPVARVLSDLERQRLHARPVRISSKTGLPQPIRVPPPTPASAGPRQPEPTRAGLALPRSPAQVRAAARSGNTPTAFDAPPLRGGPAQTFRPIPSDGSPAEPTGPMNLRQAVDMLWQQVPCQLVLALIRRADGRPEVIAARGLGERDALAGRLAPSDGMSQLLRSRGRARYPAGSRRLRFLCGEEVSLDLEVRSSLCAPLPETDGRGATLLLVNASQGEGGFDEAQLRAVTYLAKMLSTA